MKTMDLLQTFWRERAVAIVRTPDREAAGAAMDAAVDGGFRICEFTLGTPGALDHIRSFSRREGLCVGAGTVLTVDQARACVDAGARFLVSPVVDEAVIEEADRLGVASLPGTSTPTEMWRAVRAGATFQKWFPAGGPDALRTILGPLPFLRVVPTSGVELDNAAAYLVAGAFAVGFVRPLFDPAHLAAKRWTAIADSARALLAAVRTVERPDAYVVRPAPGQRDVRRDLFGGHGAVEVEDLLGARPAAPFDAVLQCELEPGGSVGKHRQEHSDQLVIGLSGDGLATVDAQPCPLGPGQVVHLPLGATLSIHNRSDTTPLRYLIVKARRA